MEAHSHRLLPEDEADKEANRFLGFDKKNQARQPIISGCCT